MAHGSLIWPHTGAILCGGRATRMGAPKHDLALPDGRSMIQTVAESVEQVCANLVILGPPDILPDRPHAIDLREAQGPLGGIEALLASGLDEQYLVVPCDLPRLTSALLRRLTTPTERPLAAFRIEDREHAESMPLRISASCLPDVQALLDAGRRAVHGLFDRLDAELVGLPSSDAALLANVNTADEFRSLFGAEPDAPESG